MKVTELQQKPKGKPRVLKVVRSIAGERGLVETKLRSTRNAVKFAVGKPVSRRDFFAVRTGSRGRFGVFGMGGCDVQSIVGAGPLLADFSGRTLCIGSFGRVGQTRSDLLLQTLDPPDESVTREVVDRLGLIDTYFSPVLFQEEFAVPDQFGLGVFPKNVVVLSLSADQVRTLYRHREHGFLVDPGGWWLSADMDAVLNDLSAVKWFAANFVKAHRLTVDESMANFGRIIEEVRERTGAFVVLLNLLTVDPGSSSLDYRHANSPNRVRRREFGVATAGLAARQGVPLLDVDRLTKEIGISSQADFVHYTPEQKSHIAREFTELLIDAGVVGSRA